MLPVDQPSDPLVTSLLHDLECPPKLHDLLRQRQRARGLTQLRVASAAKITASHYSRIEAGSRQPGFETCVSLLSVLGYSLADATELATAYGLKPTKRGAPTQYAKSKTIDRQS